MSGRKFLFALSGFLFSLQILRAIDLLLWGSGGVPTKDILFFLGPKNGDQMFVHVFHLVGVPLLTWVWTLGSNLLFERIHKWPEIRIRGFFLSFLWGVQMVAAWPLVFFIAVAFKWTIPSAILAASLIIFPIKFQVAHKKFLSEKFIFFENPIFKAAVLVGLYFLIIPGVSVPPIQIDWYHEGDQFGPARDFLLGKVPYRDIFVAQGLIQNILKPAFSFVLWGEQAISKRLLDDVLYPGGYIALFILAGLIIRTGWIWIGFLLTAPIIFPHFSDRHLFACLALGALALSIRTQQNARKASYLQFTAGGFATIQFWYSMELGVFTLFAGLIFLLVDMLNLGKAFKRKKSFQSIGIYLFGILACSAPVFIYLAFHGAVGDFFRVTYCRLGLHTYAEGIPYKILKVAPLVAKGLKGVPLFLNNLVLAWYIPLLIQYAALTLVVFRWKSWAVSRRKEAVLLTSASILMFYPVLTHNNPEHLSFSIPYSLLLGLWMIEEVRGPNWVRTGFAYWIGFVCLFYFSTIFAFKDRLLVRLGLVPERTAHVLRSSFQRPIGTFPDAEVINLETEMKEAIKMIGQHSTQKDSLFSLTEKGVIYFMSKRTNASRYYLPDYLYSETIENEVISSLSISTNTLLLTPKNLGAIQARPRRSLTLLPKWIHENYEEIWEGDLYKLWKPIKKLSLSSNFVK